MKCAAGRAVEYPLSLKRDTLSVMAGDPRLRYGNSVADRMVAIYHQPGTNRHIEDAIRQQPGVGHGNLKVARIVWYGPVGQTSRADGAAFIHGDSIS